MFEMSNKLHKIWLKWLNPHIYIVERLNLFYIFLKINSKFHSKLKNKNIFNLKKKKKIHFDAPVCVQIMI